MANAAAYPSPGDHTPSARARREQHWRRIHARFRESGLTRAAFCRREKINTGAFSWWARELSKRDQSGAPTRRQKSPKKRTQRPSFVPVRVIQASPRNGTSALEVVTRSGHVVRLQPDFDPATLRKVLAALEGQPC